MSDGIENEEEKLENAERKTEELEREIEENGPSGEAVEAEVEEETAIVEEIESITNALDRRTEQIEDYVGQIESRAAAIESFEKREEDSRIKKIIKELEKIEQQGIDRRQIETLVEDLEAAIGYAEEESVELEELAEELAKIGRVELKDSQELREEAKELKEEIMLVKRGEKEAIEYRNKKWAEAEEKIGREVKSALRHLKNVLDENREVEKEIAKTAELIGSASEHAEEEVKYIAKEDEKLKEHVEGTPLESREVEEIREMAKDAHNNIQTAVEGAKEALEEAKRAAETDPL